MAKKVSIVGIQTIPTKDKDHNLKETLELMDEALANHKFVDVVVLPEYFYYAPENYEGHLILEYPVEVKEALAIRAKTYNTYIVAGTVANKREDGKLYNTCLLFDRSGEVVGSYDKIHLFDVLNASEGEQESDLITAGDHILTYDADFGKIGIMVCYDIRFPEFARTLALQGVQYLFAPAAFYSPRIDHWQDLLRSTALLNSMYVTGVNLYGKLNATNVFCGRSLIADPWGVSNAVASDKACYIQAYVDSEYPTDMREAVGSMRNRVPKVYDIK